MGKRTKVLAGSAVVLVLGMAVLGGAVWYFVLRSDAPDKVSLAGALNSIGTATPAASATVAASPKASASTSPGSTTTSADGATSSLSGSWAPDATQPNFLGYRVVEELVRIGANTAVGRTSSVTGNIAISGDSATSATITADLTKLRSDNNLRDGQLHNQAIQTNTYPTATFELSQPVVLDATLAGGQQIGATLNGKFTLHGVTKDVAVPVQAQLKNDLLIVVGSLEIKFSDYNISKPNGNSVISIEDHGVMEFQLFLKKS